VGVSCLTGVKNKQGILFGDPNAIWYGAENIKVAFKKMW
jgi:hypothetical protein